MDILAKQNIDLAFFAVSAAAAWFAYIVYLAIYRLYLHPLADFPGPKLAALSKWYEFYYEVVLVGQFTFHIQELHKKYGKLSQLYTYREHGSSNSPCHRANRQDHSR